MTRRLGDLSPEEREDLIERVHAEAEQSGWHQLSNAARSELYKAWEARFGITHEALKDGVMKGFDAAQGIPPSGEAAIQAEVEAVLASSHVPYWGRKVKMWKGRGQADFVFGFTPSFLTHIVELEPAPSWKDGLTQALWYKSAYYQESQIQAIPTLILFGKVTTKRWSEIQTTCLDQRVLLVTHSLLVDEEVAPLALRDLLRSGPSGGVGSQGQRE